MTSGDAPPKAKYQHRALKNPGQLTVGVRDDADDDADDDDEESESMQPGEHKCCSYVEISAL